MNAGHSQFATNEKAHDAESKGFQQAKSVTLKIILETSLEAIEASRLLYFRFGELYAIATKTPKNRQGKKL